MVMLTKIAPTAKVRYRSAWTENNRIRIQGTKNLVDAALAAGAKIVVYPSVVFVYPDSGDQWITSDTPTKAIGFLESTMAAEREIARFGRHGGRGVTLRMGLFYGPESSQTQELIQAARLGIAFIPGPAHGYIPSIWVQDAASAVVEAMERAPSGTYNVVDDEPLTRAELTQAIARAVGRRNLIRLPMWLTRMIVGRDMTAVLARSQRVSNRHFKEVTGWSPAVKSAWEGWAMLGANNKRSVRSAHV